MTRGATGAGLPTDAGVSGAGRQRRDFLLVVLTKPDIFPGEAECLEGLLEAGLMKLHLRKPGAGEREKRALLERLAGRWAGRLVWHGDKEMAGAYGIPQVHGSVRLRDGQGKSGGGPLMEPAIGDAGLRLSGEDPSVMRNGGPPVISTSVHSWEEMRALPAGLAYAFISPLYDSISKPGYAANTALLEQPAGELPCMAVGLGGIGPDAIADMMRRGWKGAAVLGWIWEEPREAVRRFEQLKKIADEQ